MILFMQLLQRLLFVFKWQNEMFYRYKDGARIASDYAKAGKMEDLEQHCVNQVWLEP